MSVKRCAYKGCGAISKTTNPSQYTFYSFPKDPERCRIWLRLGGCREPIPNPMRYFCSKHFDESKYVAHNQRRKQLLSTAIPWPYNLSPQREIISDEVDYQCVVSTIDDNDDDDASLERFDDDADSVEVSNDIRNISDTMEDALQSYEYHDDCSSNVFAISELTAEKKTLKRKIDKLEGSEPVETASDNHNIISKRATSSTIVVETSNDFTSEDRGLKVIEELDESVLLFSDNVTTFIFKEQEYVQMPKNEYIQEKMALLQKIRAYEDILKNVKQLMDNVSL